jgi:radical SAM protein with 4Fe4S-binding SPASM domain
MRKVKLVNDAQFHEFNFVNSQQFMPDCDCACPIEGPILPTLDFPAYYALELTATCNNLCPSCSNVFERRRDPLPFVDWQVILDAIMPYAVRLKLTGGEPTLHPDFARIHAEIERRSIPYTLFTNARWHNPQYIIDMLKDTTTCTGALVSLHGASVAAHEAFTNVPGSFKETVTNIERATKAGLSIHLSCVLTQHNLDQIRDFVTLGQKLGASMIVFNRHIGVPVDGLTIKPTQLAKAVEHINDLRCAGQPVRYGTCIPQCFTSSSSTGCLAGTAYCTIDPWGNLRPCNHSPWIAGNVLDKSLASAWHSDVMQRWRVLIPEACTTCNAFSQCRGGCRAEALLNGVEQDPLMTSSISRSIVKPLRLPLQLYQHARIHFTCELRRQGFGYLLVQGDRLMPGNAQLSAIVHAAETYQSLHDIEEKFGQPALNFIGVLYEQGFIDLSW